MKKRFVSALLAALMLLTLLPVTAFGAEEIARGYCGGNTATEYDSTSGYYKNLTWTLDNAGTLTISGSGVMADYGWWSSPWYAHADSITTVTIESGVTNIADYAFRGCSKLTSITIPSGVTSIGDSAFHGCSKLTSITIPSGVTSIGDGAFAYCSSLTSVTIPSSVTSIGILAFVGLANIEVDSSNPCYSGKDGVLYNKDMTELIQYCNSRKSFVVPDSVTGIGIGAFYFAKLEKVYFNDTIAEIDVSAFGVCPISDVYYSGSETDWSKVTIYGENDPLKNAKMHYNVKSVPADFYDDGGGSDDGGGGSSGGGGCYVATCVYGSYDCPEVWTLRRFRDETLAQTWCGRAFIHTYYAISPTLVKWFGDTNWFKNMWRGTLDKMVANLNAEGVPDTPYDDIDW